MAALHREVSRLTSYTLVCWAAWSPSCGVLTNIYGDKGLTNLIMAIATGCFVGYLPIAPGTWGSALAIPIHFLLIRLSTQYYFTALVIIFVISVVTAGSAEKIIDRKDPGVIVIDEIIGMLITLINAPNNLLVWILGFFVFRFFDILKPFPIGLIDRRINGGIGIVMDDVLAGVYSLIVLQIICRIFF